MPRQPYTLPGSKTDREHASYVLDRDGEVAQRVDIAEGDLLSVIRSLLVEMRKVRIALELILGQEIDS